MTRSKIVKTLLVVGALALSFGLGHATAQNADRTVAGTWQVRGWNGEKIDAPAYQGTIEIEKRSDHNYHVVWKVPDEIPGIGIYDAKHDVFAAAYVLGGKPGIALYRPSADGQRMEGLWTLAGHLDKEGHEEWRH